MSWTRSRPLTLPLTRTHCPSRRRVPGFRHLAIGRLTIWYPGSRRHFMHVDSPDGWGSPRRPRCGAILESRARPSAQARRGPQCANCRWFSGRFRTFPLAIDNAELKPPRGRRTADAVWTHAILHFIASNPRLVAPSFRATHRLTILRAQQHRGCTAMNSPSRPCQSIDRACLRKG